MSAFTESPSLAKVRGGVFYLHGEDEFRKEEVVRALVESHLDPATRDFNLDQLRGSEVDAETLASILGTPPMMAEWRVVVLREVEGLAGSARTRDILMDVVGRPAPGLALVLSCTVPSGSKAKFYKDLAKAARSVEFQPISAADAPGWVMTRARDRFGVEMDPDAARALCAAVGTDLGVLSQEMLKLGGYVGERGRITVEDVAAAGIHIPRQDRWRWFDMVAEKRFEEALATVGILLDQDETGVSLVAGLATHFLRLGIAGEQGTAGLEAVLPQTQRWLARNLVSQARNWRSPELEAALAGLLRADRLLKSSSGLSHEHVLEEWLLTLLARKAAA